MSIFDELQQASQHLSEAVQQLQASTCGIEKALDGHAALHPNVAQAMAAANILRSFCMNRTGGAVGCMDCPFAEPNGDGGTGCKLEQIPEAYPRFTVKGIQ